MKLRTRFALLIVGIVVVPPLTFGLVLFVNSLTWTSPENLKEIAVSQHLIRELRNGELTVQEASQRLEESGFSSLVIVLGSDGLILSPANRAGRAGTVETILADLHTEGASWATVLSVADENGGLGYVAVANPSRNFAEQVANTAFIIPLGFILTVAGLSALVIRSINRSITRLETATRRIAEGNLDFELETVGKDKIADLTRSFETMRRQLKEQLDRSSRFIMGLSHDLKTPLSSITGYVDAIRDGYADTPEKLDKYTSIIHAKTQLLESRISGLIDYAKQESREWKASLRPVPVLGFMKEFVSLVEAESHARHFEFAHSIEVPPDVEVMMDQDMVGRALDNLVENAFAHATPGSEIRVSASLAAAAAADDRTIVITVDNEGAGIPPDQLPHIFDPLYRGGGDRAGNGFGLGLATVKSVIASHGWGISVSSVPGKRTVFAVTVPGVRREPWV